MQNAVNESFWDAHGVEIGPCANFDPKTLLWGTGKLWGLDARGLFNIDFFCVVNPEHPIPIFSPGRQFFRIRKIVEICACLNLEVLNVPEGLVHSIRILEAPAVFLARR